MKKLIYIIGIDGAGKTTLAKGLVKKLCENDINARYIYARHIPILLFPLKVISKITLYRKHSEFKNYKKYSEIKYGFSKRHKILAKIYAAIWALDYLIFTGIKFYSNFFFSNIIVIDRYVADVVVNISIASQLKTTELKFLLNIFHNFFPKPDLCFFINIDEEIAFQRKNDIQSVQYLKERTEKYKELENYYNFIVIDGSLPKNKLLLNVYSKIKLN